MRPFRSASRTLLRSIGLAAVLLAGAVTGCTADQTIEAAAGTAADPVANSTTAAPPDPDAPIALVVTDDGLAGVPVGSSTPVWTAAGAVAAPDGSAVYAVRPVEAGAPGAGPGFEVVAIDPRTGSERPVGRHVPGPKGIRVAAVEPGGDQLILVAPAEGDATLVLTFDPARSGGGVKQVFEGVVEPEAFSVDRALVFAARIYSDRYHVHVLDLAAGTQTPTLGPDKSLPPEDMYGDVVQAVLSPDRSQLATLYRDDRSADHTAFVHLLSLQTGLTVCIDLHAPFGTGPAGSDAIEWRADGTVVVGNTPGAGAASTDLAMSASFDPSAIWDGEPQAHYHADAVADPDPPAVPEAVSATEGFRRFVAIAPVDPD